MKNEIQTIDGATYIAINSKTFGFHLVRIDAEDVDLIEQYKWRIARTNGRINCVCHINKQTIYLSRFLTADQLAGTKNQVFFKDGEPLNCSRSNLEILTPQQKQFRKPGAKGYYYRPKTDQYMAYITVDGKMRYIGLYATPEEARQAYLDAKEELHNA